MIANGAGGGGGGGVKELPPPPPPQPKVLSARRQVVSTSGRGTGVLTCLRPPGSIACVAAKWPATKRGARREALSKASKRCWVPCRVMLKAVVAPAVTPS